MHQRRNLTTRVSLALHDEAAAIALSELFLYLKCLGNQLITKPIGRETSHNSVSQATPSWRRGVNTHGPCLRNRAFYSLLNVSPALRTTLRRNSMRAVTSSSTKFRAASMTVLRRD